MNKQAEVSRLVYDLVSQIPQGKVSTYGDIANVIGINPRYVGFVLHNNPMPGIVPCHRVVNSMGQISSGFAFGGPNVQRKLLEDEGVVFLLNKIDLKVFRHKP